ncbi:AzlC family ABC transporter permease [Streptomyces venetus]|uniref:AzlC family ABC transporter permease n=1 Tax=Streptomyces venetus TaxID=1701086 RepID=UPI003CD07DB4
MAALSAPSAARAAVQGCASAGLGMLPLGLAFGALVVRSGLDYALSFPLHRVRGRLAKTYSTFALTDEAYALTAGEQARGWSSPRILWLQCYLHLYWAGSATAGACSAPSSSPSGPRRRLTPLGQMHRHATYELSDRRLVVPRADSEDVPA